MEQIAFQIEAVEKLIQSIKTLWSTKGRQIPIVFKAPTGSGKTYMTEKMICDLAEQPDWDRDVAYVWITFSEDLALQSKEKFDKYFSTSKHGRLLTIEDFNLGRLQKNDVLFLNWQKLVSQEANKRIYRRPTDERERHECRVYFEDFIDNTHNAGVEIILIIDESHLNVTEAAYHDVIDPIDPKIILNVSATPKKESIADAVVNGAVILVKHEDVVAQGLIKENIICQTEEELKKYEGKDDAEELVKLAIDKRTELKKSIESFGLIDFNPLVIIQLPNDESDLVEQGKQTEEEHVKQILIANGVKQENIASWFTGKAKPIGLELNNSKYEFLLFKMAAGTGWDCPRAQILVMLRDVKSQIFETQTIGRIIRVPIMNQEVSKVFRNGYIYTNYSKDAVLRGDYSPMDGNKPKTLISHNKKGGDYTIDEELLTSYLSRVNYGDLGQTGQFQECLIETFNACFGIVNGDPEKVLRSKLSNKGLDISAGFVHNVITNIEFKDFEKIGIDIQSANQSTIEWGRTYVQKWFTLSLFNILAAQTDNDCKVGNKVRSVPALKSAIRLWFKDTLPSEPEDTWYRIFLNDVINNAPSSIFKRLITKTLKAYHPLLEKQLEERRRENEQRQNEPFVVKKMYAFTEEYEALDHINKCLLSPFYLRKEYDGRKTEEPFAKYLDSQSEIDWWFKNGDSGKDWLAIRYFDEASKDEALFYPDWIYRKKDGTIGIFDTKGGITASAQSTKNKAEALHKRIEYLNGWNRETKRYEGGIVIQANGMWYYNDNATYNYRKGSTDGWKNMNDLFKCLGAGVVYADKGNYSIEEKEEISRAADVEN